MALKVYYGYAKLNNTIKKPSLKIIFENGNNNPERNLKRIESWMHIVCVRDQTEGEATDAQYPDQMFTIYEYFINEKPYRGDLEMILEQNYNSDSNHVPEKEREEIKTRLRDAHARIYIRRQ